MNQIIFPSEIQVFESLLSSATLKLLGNKLSKVNVVPSKVKLTDWYKIAANLHIEHSINSAPFWAFTAKLAWILTDVDFFNSRLSLLDEFKDSP
ncbi:MAG: hypothetical protein ACW97W_09105, partial [Candidatus Hodarchaeales archaeon]